MSSSLYFSLCLSLRNEYGSLTDGTLDRNVLALLVLHVVPVGGGLDRIPWLVGGAELGGASSD